jgi:hypothetical protein
METEEIWRKQWLKTLEVYETHLFWPTRDDWNVSIDFIKSFGSLVDVLNMIEKGDQGIPLRKWVQAIRENEVRMKILGKEWARGRYVDSGLCADDEY